MRATYREVPVSGRRSSYRVTLSVLSLLAAVTIIIALTVQIADRVVNGAFEPEEYFSYFTIQSSLGNIVVLTASGIYGLQSSRDSRLLSAIRSHFVVYALITAAVYNFLLRNLPAAEGSWESSVQWPNEITHVWIPLYFVLDWLLNPHRPQLPGVTVPMGLLFPAAWFGYTLAHGYLTGWYPYAFMNPSSDAGWPGVALFAGGIAVTNVALLHATTFTNLLHAKLRPAARLIR